MLDVLELEKAISKAGIKKTFLAEQIGVSKTVWYRIMNGKRQFKIAEIFVIRTLLGLTEEDVQRIFFSKKVDV